MLAKKTSKNQITLPKRIVEQLPEAEYFDVRVEGGAIVLRPVAPDGIGQVRKKLAEMALSEQDIQAAVDWARSTSR